MRYESEADVKLRLGSSLVRKGETPVYIKGVESINKVIVYDPIKRETDFAKVSDLNLTPVPLGYVERDGEVLYVTRKPTRKYKQGLTQENMVAKDVLSGRLVALRIDDRGLSKAILGQYPSIEQSFQQCRDGADIVPFSREWAVANYKGELCVMHKGSVVGYVGDDNVMLSPDKYFLKESLMEVLNV